MAPVAGLLVAGIVRTNSVELRAVVGSRAEGGISSGRLRGPLSSDIVLLLTTPS